jgi:hypothetical protein
MNQQQRAVVQQALEALENRCGTNADERKELIPALRQLLEQPVQEPVARVIDNGTPEGATEWIPFANRVEPLKTGDLLYTTPPAQPAVWVGLTDEEIILKALHLSGLGTSPDVLQFARAIEAKLREKNGGTP